MHSDLLLEVWREVGRHTELSAAVRKLADLIRPEVAFDDLMVFRVDRIRGVWEPVAAPRSAAARPGTPGRPYAGDLRRLAPLFRSGRCRRASREEVPAEARSLLALAPGADALVGPLGPRGRLDGLLALVRSVRPFDDGDANLADRLLEPFGAVLENDRRLRELASLNAAVEADKRSLLAKLGREDLADVIVGTDAGLKPVMERVELVARSDVPVLIIGETGTGKELVARAIHTRSGRASGPFLRVNCGAIPPELIDSQLFGHEKGAFTGAVERRVGWFQRADGGTLLLDEIGELPLAAQVRLLRILQDGWMEPVGSHAPVRVDARIVAATHRNLPDMVAERTFREDLWYRIAVFPILLPPLRDRPEDIPALARHLALRAARRFGLARVPPTAEDIARLQAYPWPGNVREMGTVIDRAAILGNGHTLEVATALGAFPERAAAGRSPSTPTPSQPAERDGDAGAQELRTLDEVARIHMERVLSETLGRIDGPYGAAVRLRIHPNTLRARMRRLKIDWRQFRGKPA